MDGNGVRQGSGPTATARWSKPRGRAEAGCRRSLPALVLAWALAAGASAPLAAGAVEISKAVLLNHGASSDDWEDRAPALATDGEGVWVVVWQTLGDARSRSHRPTWDIAFTRSTDDGIEWTPPVLLAAGSAADRASDEHPAVAADGRGGWVALWQSIGEGDSAIVAVHSKDGGERWSEPALLSPAMRGDGAQDLRPSVVGLDDGTLIAAWERSFAESRGETEFRIVVSRSRDGGATWSRPLPLGEATPTSAGGQRRVALAALGIEGAVAVWESFVAGAKGSWSIEAATTQDAGRTWTAAETVAASPGGAFDPVPLAASTPAEAAQRPPAIVLWSSAEHGEYSLRRSLRGDSGWEEDTPLLAGEELRARSASAARLADGTAVYAWEARAAEVDGVARDEDRDVFLAVGAGDAAPDAPLPAADYQLADGDAYDGSPRVAAAGGTALVVWTGNYAGEESGPLDGDLRMVRIVVSGRSAAEATSPASPNDEH